MKKLLLIMSAMIMSVTLLGCSTAKWTDKNSNGTQMQMQNKYPFEGD